MNKVYGATKPSLEDALEHHGVRGQKWGVRRAEKLRAHGQKLQAKAQNPKNSNRTNRNLQIKIARTNVAARQHEIDQLTRAANKAKTPQERQKLDALATKKASALFNHPDQVTASRMTTGEKVVSGLLIGGSIAVAGAQGAAAAAGPRVPRSPGVYRTTAHVGPH